MATVVGILDTTTRHEPASWQFPVARLRPCAGLVACVHTGPQHTRTRLQPWRRARLKTRSRHCSALIAQVVYCKYQTLPFPTL